MRIGMVTACYHPRLNGVTQMLALYQKHMTALGHEVTIFTLRGPNQFRDDPGVHRSLAIPLGEGYYFTPRYSRRTQARLRKMDILHCHHLIMGVDMARRYSQAPIVFTNHTRYDLYGGVYFPLPGWLAEPLIRWFWPRLANQADAVVAPSAGMGAILKQYGVCPPIEVIPNGIELDRFHTPSCHLSKTDLGLSEKSVLCVYVGRISREKNVAHLIDQFAQAQEKLPDLHLMLIGTGKQRRELERKTRQMGIASHIRFLGQIPPERLPGYLNAADLFVSASRSEVHPLTAIEAMAAGLPVIAPAGTGFTETVEPGVTGLLLRDQGRGLSDALIILGADQNRRDHLGRAARHASQRFSIRKTVERTLRLYQRLQ